MPRSAVKTLGTDREVKSAVNSGGPAEFRIRGAANLVLRIAASGGNSWVFRFKSPRTGKWSRTALGSYPSLGVADAKDRATNIAGEVRAGSDPTHDRRVLASADTFQLLGELYLAAHTKKNAREGRESQTTQEARRVLHREIYPSIGTFKISAIERHHVAEIIVTIRKRGADVLADRALGLVRATFNWACGEGLAERDPTFGLKKRNTGRPKTRVLSPEEIRLFWNAIENWPELSEGVRDAMRLQLLTGVRISEAMEAEVAEFDLSRALWIIPAIRTKAEREHRLPLSPLAVEIVRQSIERARKQAQRREEHFGGTEVEVNQAQPRWAFPAPTNDKPMRPRAATKAIARARQCKKPHWPITEDFNTHDLRRTVATQLGDMGISEDVIGRILNHAPRTVTGKHYALARHEVAMRQALEGWGERLEKYVTGQTKEHRNFSLAGVTEAA